MRKQFSGVLLRLAVVVSLDTSKAGEEYAAVEMRGTERIPLKIIPVERQK
jgi:hypothetical protein